MKKNLREIETILKKHKSKLKEKFKVKKIGVFGSYARGEDNGASDVDILVELYEPLGWEIVDLKDYLEEILGLNVDLVTVKALKPQLSRTILNEVVYA